jgi:hypothetical protein
MRVEGGLRSLPKRRALTSARTRTRGLIHRESLGADHHLGRLQLRLLRGVATIHDQCAEDGPRDETLKSAESHEQQQDDEFEDPDHCSRTMERR